MNQDINPLELVVKDISPSQTPAVVLPANPSVDAVAAALVLYFGLGKQGKQAIVSCPTPINYAVPGVEHIKSTLTGGGRNLVISFPYSDGSIDKVDYRIENNTFNLIVIPREGFEKITPDQMNYSYQGGTPDTFVTMGAGNLQSLGKLYQDNKQILDTLPLVVVNRQKPGTSFGSSEYTREGAFLIELACELLQTLEIQIDQNIATCAFGGISLLTNNFSNENTTPEIFELAGRLMRMGAQKPQISKVAGTNDPQRPNTNESSRKWMEKPKSQNMQQNSQKNRFGQQGNAGTNAPQKQSSNQAQSAPQNANMNKPNPQKPVRPERYQNSYNAPKSVEPSLNTYETENADFESTSEDVAETRTSGASQPRPVDTQESNNNSLNPQEDWLKPKIFKGGGFI